MPHLKRLCPAHALSTEATRARGNTGRARVKGRCTLGGIQLAVVLLAGVDDGAHVGEPIHIDAGPMVVVTGRVRLLRARQGVPFPAPHHPLRQTLAEGPLDGSQPRRRRGAHRPEHLRSGGALMAPG